MDFLNFALMVYAGIVALFGLAIVAWVIVYIWATRGDK
jgi:hypothetical protein